MIFQDSYASLDPRMTVGDIIGEGIDIHELCSGEERQRVIILWCNSMQLMERMHSGGSFVIPVRDIICSRLWVIGCLI